MRIEHAMKRGNGIININIIVVENVRLLATKATQV
jgi:hypothetical protein